MDGRHLISTTFPRAEVLRNGHWCTIQTLLQGMARCPALGVLLETALCCQPHQLLQGVSQRQTAPWPKVMSFPVLSKSRDWLRQGYKGSTIVTRHGASLVGHSLSRACLGLAEASVGLPSLGLFPLPHAMFLPSLPCMLIPSSFCRKHSAPSTQSLLPREPNQWQITGFSFFFLFLSIVKITCLPAHL